ncbi:DUF3232 domain-containing protein [Candidatus Kaiserbacteria bacterium]|nr:DUF3232 domain-containing protein [Candidatus Kaiserbacteria bacterium]
MEDLPQDKRESHVAPPTEELIAVTNGALEECSHNPGAHCCDVDVLHHDVENSDFGSIFKRYENHEIFRIKDIQESVDFIISDFESWMSTLEENDEEFLLGDKSINLLKERVNIIESGIRSYVSTLQEFFLIKKQQFRLDREVYIDRLQNIDRRRRIAHDSLIESLNVYTDSIKQLVEYGLLDESDVQEWSFGFSDYDKNITIFSKSFLSDRNLIKDWALSAHMYQQLEKIEELQKMDTE